MPFLEHRGGGKKGSRVETMESRWDAEWAESDSCETSPDLSQSEHWPHIQRIASPPARILEAGCGLARWVAFLDRKGYEAFGLDYSQVAVERSLAAWPGSRLTRGDLRDMPYETASFDAIVSFGAIEHDVNGPEAALAEMHRVLKPGGNMYCTVPCMNWVKRCGLLALQDYVVCNATIRRLMGRQDDAAFFEYVYRPTEYAEILEKSGFSVLELVPGGPYNLDVQGRVRHGLTMAIHRRFPWCLAHMVGAICRKPVAAA